MARKQAVQGEKDSQSLGNKYNGIESRKWRAMLRHTGLRGTKIKISLISVTPRAAKLMKGKLASWKSQLPGL